MILLDTNVFSELIKPSPKPSVIDWLNANDTATLFLPAVAIAEIEYGVEALPEGKRKTALANAVEHFIDEGFANRLVAFDRQAARQYGRIMARCRSAGKTMSVIDGQIAATAASNDFTLATRNVKDFAACDIALTNPFD